MNRVKARDLSRNVVDLLTISKFYFYFWFFIWTSLLQFNLGESWNWYCDVKNINICFNKNFSGGISYMALMGMMSSRRSNHFAKEKKIMHMFFLPRKWHVFFFKFKWKNKIDNRITCSFIAPYLCWWIDAIRWNFFGFLSKWKFVSK